jgi:hypothetical protein
MVVWQTGNWHHKDDNNNHSGNGNLFHHNRRMNTNGYNSNFFGDNTVPVNTCCDHRNDHDYTHTRSGGVPTEQKCLLKKVKMLQEGKQRLMRNVLFSYMLFLIVDY